jgi:hypothetical protein
MRRHLPEFQACYQDELSRAPNTSDTQVILDLHILPTGTVAEAKATGGNATLTDCIASVAGKLHFEPSIDSLHISYPFAFATVR